MAIITYTRKQCIRSSYTRTLSFKMAPHRKSIKALQKSSNSTLDKENNYLRSLSDYQARVRRRESIRNYKNVAQYDLERKIELEIKIKEGSTRLLAAAQHPAQSLEAARALFTSNERMSTYMTELQHREENASFKTNISESNGKLSISDFRFPLMWRDSDHFKNRGDYRRFAVFCLVRVGAEVQDTSLLYPVDREQTDISFPDTLLFNNVSAEFELTLEVYSHVLQEDLSIASTPRKIRKSIHSSISKTVGRKLGASLRDQNDATKIPKFDLLAYAKMTLDDTDNNVRSHNLTLNSFDNKTHALPLFGHFCCRLAVKPNFIDKKVSTEFVIINNQRYWTQLQGFQIEAWKSKKLVEKLEKPTYTIRLNRETLVQRSKSTNYRLRITNQIDGVEKLDLMELDSNENLQRWFEQLTTRIKEHSKWKHAAISLQQIPCSENLNKHANLRNCFVDDKLRGSIYDNTMLIDNTFKQMQRHFR